MPSFLLAEVPAMKLEGSAASQTGMRALNGRTLPSCASTIADVNTKSFYIMNVRNEYKSIFVMFEK